MSWSGVVAHAAVVIFAIASYSMAMVPIIVNPLSSQYVSVGSRVPMSAGLWWLCAVRIVVLATFPVVFVVSLLLAWRSHDRYRSHMRVPSARAQALSGPLVWASVIARALVLVYGIALCSGMLPLTTKYIPTPNRQPIR